MAAVGLIAGGCAEEGEPKSEADALRHEVCVQALDARVLPDTVDQAKQAAKLNPEFEPLAEAIENLERSEGVMGLTKEQHRQLTDLCRDEAIAAGFDVGPGPPCDSKEIC